MLTITEIQLTEKIGDCFSEFVKLPVMYPSDLNDVLFHIHALQAIIMKRAAQRQHPETFHTIKKDVKK